MSTETVTIDCLTTTHDGVLYAAGACYVTIGRAQTRAVACRAGDMHYITTIEHAPEWLTEHGLPADTAAAIVRDALAKDDAA